MLKKAFMAGTLPVEIYDNRDEMGKAAAKDAAAILNKLIAEKGEVSAVFAAAPSQNDFLKYLLLEDIDWTKVTAFHMDEYINLSKEHPAGFANFLREAIFSKKPFKAVNYLNCEAPDAEAECERYSKLLSENTPDIIFLGVGENGHLAFNDPPVADFNDPKKVKIVELEQVCRQQQVNDGCFATIDEVPKTAMSLTMSMIMEIKNAIVVVPAPTKRNAIKALIEGPITTACPASILKTHKAAKLFCDSDSGADFI